jgi:SpoVK/Ycf46/Vps4 family AAA+-type ATPase
LRAPADVDLVVLDVPAPGCPERLRLWAAAVGELVPPPGAPGSPPDLPGLAATFRLTGGQIRGAVRTARGLAIARSPAAPRVTDDDLYRAARLHSHRTLATLARHIVPRRGWDDLVLPADRTAQLREIVDQVRYRDVVYETWAFEQKTSGGHGLTVLFAGPPGTGKTMAAEVLAHTLGVDLYAIDLSMVVSKFVGETEKNLARIFDEATSSNAVLFFDEADALFGRRTQVRDAHDRYANLETSYLLQKLEEHEGVVVLATNLRKNMDEAFVRRLHATVDFPVPDVVDRLRLWHQVWPAETPRDPALDLELLARKVDLPGGNIRNIALAGAFLAAADGGLVTMEHLLHATRREYQKMGKVRTAGDF